MGVKIKRAIQTVVISAVILAACYFVAYAWQVITAPRM